MLFINTDGRQIVYNSLTCKKCNTSIVSHHRHDLKKCKCSNEATIDGGHFYVRYGANDLKQIQLFTVFDDDDFEIVRKYATRGTFIHEKRVYIPICELSDAHLKSILKYGGADWHIKIIKKEIEYRSITNKKTK